LRSTPSTPPASAEFDARVESLVASSAARLYAQSVDISMAMRTALSTEITELDGDPGLFELLGASIQGNVDTALHSLQHNIAAQNLEPPPAAVEYARVLAQRGVPVNALLRAYRLGQNYLLKLSFEEIGRQADDPDIGFRASQHFVSVTFSYIDWISQRLVTVYEQEREQWLRNHNTVRVARIREILESSTEGSAGTDLAASEAALGYPLRQHHLGVIVWASKPTELLELEHVVTALSRELPNVGRPLFCAWDRTSGWGWLPLGHERVAPPDPAVIAAVLADTAPDCRVAFGAPERGIAGFRATHRQALAAQQVAQVAGSDAARVIGYGQPGVRVAALLSSDLEQTRMLVRAVLGRLAVNDPQRARLRETLLTFLFTANSYTATAELLTMHKNTVKYRVARAEEERGAPIGADRLDVELALVACRWLGPQVLLPAASTT
jgi:hypothetical protein